MKDDRELMQSIRAAIDACTRSMDESPSLRCQIIQKAKGEKPVAKKFSAAVIAALVFAAIAMGALAAVLLWQEAGEKIAPMERRNGYYDTWTLEAKLDLVETLYELGELKDFQDAGRILDGSDLTDEEKDALCDQIMTEYVQGALDTVTLLSILETIHGEIETWSMEDKVWYNELLRKNNMLSAEDENYVLAQDGELTQEQAVETAKAFLSGKGISYIDQAKVEATMTEDQGLRSWSVVFRPELEGLPYGGVCSVDILADGTVVSYHVPEHIPLLMHGTLPDDAAINEEQALDIAGKAMAARLHIPENELTEMKAFYGYIDYDDEQEAHAALGEYVWAVTSGEGSYALLTPQGEILFVGERKND